MAASILVTYATRYGSTKEVADAVGARLRELGLEVDVKPVRMVRSLDGYGAVVLGTPFYIGSMLTDAREFLNRHREALAQKPVAIFALGPTSADDDATAARAQLDGALAKMPWLKPATAQMFVGKYDPAKLRFPDKLLAIVPASPLHGVTARDDRDWEAIKAWAGALPAALRLERREAR